MVRRKLMIDLPSILLGLCVILAALIGLFYTNSGKSFTSVNIYGDTVKMYGNGIYAYSSVLDAANQFGSDLAGILEGVLLISFTIWKNKPLWAEIVRTSEIVLFADYSTCLVFGPMNSLFFLYVVCFGLSIFSAFIAVTHLLSIIKVPKQLMEKSLKGTSIFLILAGVLTALIWIALILPVNISGEYGSLLGIKTNEVTYGLDLGVTCPMFIICSIWIFQKKEIGYKVAPILLYLLTGVAILVVFQRGYYMKLGVTIPIEALIIFMISFILLGTIAFYLFVELVLKLESTKNDLT